MNARGIPTAAYQVLLGGVPPLQGTPSQVWWGVPEVSTNPSIWIPPSQVWWGKGYWRWGTSTPHLGTPSPARSDPGGTRGGVPPIGVPASQVWGGTWGGVPPIRVPPGQVWQGVPEVGYPPSGYSPAWTWLGYPPRLDLAGVPPCLDLAGVPPHLTWLGYPLPRLDLAQVPPLGVDR